LQLTTERRIFNYLDNSVIFKSILLTLSYGIELVESIAIGLYISPTFFIFWQDAFFNVIGMEIKVDIHRLKGALG